MLTTKQAYIHVGTHKTASTFLQKFLLKNRETLRERGVFLPLLKETIERLKKNSGFNDPNYHLPIVRALDLGQDSIEAKETFRDLEHAIKTSSSEVVLLTSEIFEDQLTKQNILILERFFTSLGYETTFIAYIRNQPEYINSLYTQTIKRFWDNCSFDTYVDRSKDMVVYDYCRLFSEILKNKKVSFIARSYDQATKIGIETDFLDIVLGKGKYNVSDFTAKENYQNEAPGPATIFAAQLIRRIALSEFPHEKKLYLYWNRLKRLSHAKNWNERKYVGFSTDKARKIEQTFLEKNDRFAQLVWGSNWAIHYTQKKFDQNIFNPEDATLKELWEIECVVEKVLNDIRRKNGQRKTIKYSISNIARYFMKKRRYI
ncbi:MAG: hypothetical protein V7750_11640 [Sneathiella sp.]